jgi:hypothetical protein
MNFLHIIGFKNSFWAYLNTITILFIIFYLDTIKELI